MPLPFSQSSPASTHIESAPASPGPHGVVLNDVARKTWIKSGPE